MMFLLVFSFGDDFVIILDCCLVNTLGAGHLSLPHLNCDLALVIFKTTTWKSSGPNLNNIQKGENQKLQRIILFTYSSPDHHNQKCHQKEKLQLQKPPNHHQKREALRHKSTNTSPNFRHRWSNFPITSSSTSSPTLQQIPKMLINGQLHPFFSALQLSIDDSSNRLSQLSTPTLHYGLQNEPIDSSKPSKTTPNTPPKFEKS